MISNLKKCLFLMTMMTLGACGGVNDLLSNLGGESSSLLSQAISMLESNNIDSATSVNSSGGDKTQEQRLEQAFAHDYTNMSVEAYMVSDLNEEYIIEKYTNGYSIVIDEVMGDWIYHDYFDGSENNSYLYYNMPGLGEAWLKENQFYTPIGFNFVYPDVEMLIDEIELFFLEDKPINYNYFDEYDAIVIDNIALLQYIENNSMYSMIDYRLDAIIAYLDADGAFANFVILDNRTSEYGVTFEIFDRGSTTYNNLPTAPNATNTKTYAEYHNVDPWVEVRVNEIIISYPVNYPTGHLIPGDELSVAQDRISVQLLPEGYNANTVYYYYTDRPDLISLNSSTGAITAIKPGEFNIWVETYFDEVSSNVLPFVIGPFPEAEVDNKNHDLIFTGMSGTTVNYNDLVSSAPAVEITATENIAINNASSQPTKFPNENKVLLLFPQTEAKLDFHFPSHSVDNVSFNYGLFWDNDIANLSDLREFKILVSNDGVDWIEQANLLADALTLTEYGLKNAKVNFDDAYQYVRIYVKNFTVGKLVRLSLDRILFGREPLDINEINISVPDGKDNLRVGDETTITRVIDPTESSSIETVYRMSEMGVVEIDAAGKVKAVGIGVTEVTCQTLDGSFVSNTITFNVDRALILVNEITLTATEQTLELGESTTLSVAFNPSDADDQSVTYEISNVDGVAHTRIATLSVAAETGVATVTATKNAEEPLAQTTGKVRITARTSNNKTSSIVLTIINTATTGTVKIDSSTADIEMAQNTTKFISVSLSNANNSVATTSAFTLHSTDEAVANFTDSSSNGSYLKALSVGTTYIYATFISATGEEVETNRIKIEVTSALTMPAWIVGTWTSDYDEEIVIAASGFGTFTDADGSEYDIEFVGIESNPSGDDYCFDVSDGNTLYISEYDGNIYVYDALNILYSYTFSK